MAWCRGASSAKARPPKHPRQRRPLSRSVSFPRLHRCDVLERFIVFARIKFAHIPPTALSRLSICRRATIAACFLPDYTRGSRRMRWRYRIRRDRSKRPPRCHSERRAKRPIVLPPAARNAEPRDPPQGRRLPSSSRPQYVAAPRHPARSAMRPPRHPERSERSERSRRIPRWCVDEPAGDPSARSARSG